MPIRERVPARRPRPRIKSPPRSFRGELNTLQISQRGFARMIGKTESTVSSWATRKRRAPQYAFAVLDLLRHNRETGDEIIRILAERGFLPG